MVKKLIFVLFFGTAVLLSSAVYAHSWGGDSKGKECPMKMDKEHCQCPIADKFMRKAGFLLEYKSDIGLTDAQVKAIKELKLRMEKDNILQGAGMKTFMLDLQSKLSEDKVDVDGAKALIDKNFTEASAGAKSNLEAYAKLKGLLSSEQIAKMKALHEQMEKKERAEEQGK